MMLLNVMLSMKNNKENYKQCVFAETIPGFTTIIMCNFYVKADEMGVNLPSWSNFISTSNVYLGHCEHCKAFRK